MCGIAGIAALSDAGRSALERIGAATEALSKRGPDFQGLFLKDKVALGHRRLSIIDTSAAANQPMTSADGRHTIVFNGEFFNFQVHRKQLIASGHTFRTGSDTEVLLELYLREGPACLEKVNGFFAFAVYDGQTGNLFLARDRMGVKPLYYFRDNDRLIFGSELKALFAAGIPKSINHQALTDYLHLNYIPGEQCILNQVFKLLPGHYLTVGLQDASPAIQIKKYYQIPDNFRDPSRSIGNYEQALEQLRLRLDEAVQRRLISDVPLGAFLSGGLDSSIVTGIASRHTPHLKTFSIGFRDEPHFDETAYARMVSEQFNTEHTVFSLSTDDLYENLFRSLDYLDEPFADSSALAVNILSMHTRKHVTVALSGDGADEMFAGYNKHRAEWIIRNRPFLRTVLLPAAGLLSGFQGSRNSRFSNKLRQIQRFAQGARMNAEERYWRWCGYTASGEASGLLLQPVSRDELTRHRNHLLSPLAHGEQLSDVLYMDMHLVLPDDMLVKVDRMSMAHALEVRSPFMDFEVVNLAFSISDSFKIDARAQKKILRDAFGNMLPPQLLSRDKQGFEIPLLNWLRKGLNGQLQKLLLDRDFIEAQGLFSYDAIAALHQQLLSPHPGDATARIWGLLVFQYWWKMYFADSNSLSS